MNHLAKICRVSPLLPVLVGVLTVTSMFAANANRGLNWGELPLPLAVVCCWATVWWLIFFAIPKVRKAGGLGVVVASMFVLITMLWGVFPQFPEKYFVVGNVIPFLLVLIAVIFVVKYRLAVIRFTPALSAVVTVAILFSLVQAGFGITSTLKPISVSASVGVPPNSKLPDIYFIIPDRFGSIDGLEESGLDASGFVQELRDRGFYVRENALSDDPIKPTDWGVDTTRTLRYLASVLNMGEPIDLHIGYTEAGRMVRNPEVAVVLHSMGYKYYNIGSWYAETAISRVADFNYVYITSNPIMKLYADEFGAAVLDRSFLRFTNILTGEQTERDRQMFQAKSIGDIAGNGVQPKFVFAHILLPHVPFIWTADGKPQTSKADDMTLYLQQVQFTEGYLLEIIDQIQAQDKDAVIIVQSDEGICFVSQSESKKLSDTQWNGVLTAWHIPSAQEGELEKVDTRDILKFVVGGLKNS